jgi:RNA polymerase sigma-70 factor (ECF subfamily)
MDQHTLKAHFLKAYDQYADPLYRFCYMKTSSTALAEDLTQETFMRFWQRLREGVVVKSAQALLYTIARNLVIDWYRKKKEQSLDALQEAGADFAGEGSGEIVAFAEAREALAVVDRLDEPSREVLLLRFVEGYSPQEIAAYLGTSANVISVRINRAIKKVQEIIRPHD